MTTSPTLPPAARSSLRKGRDRETIELFCDFLAESAHGIARAEEILLDPQDADAERVRELFRVFHTIAGASAFLGTLDVTRLAHATETLLDGAREGRYPFNGPMRYLVFEATATMRSLLSEVRRAVVLDTEIRRDPALPDLIAELQVEAYASEYREGTA